MKYHALLVILKKQQNSKLSSAANYRWPQTNHSGWFIVKIELSQLIISSKTCPNQPLKNRQNKGIKDKVKWCLMLSVGPTWLNLMFTLALTVSQELIFLFHHII